MTQKIIKHLSIIIIHTQSLAFHINAICIYFLEFRSDITSNLTYGSHFHCCHPLYGIHRSQSRLSSPFHLANSFQPYLKFTKVKSIYVIHFVFVILQYRIIQYAPLVKSVAI